ncbi:DUF3800 domain-containing protein [Corynebacterium mastitidis]|uniref:DUF3800 domain-containing protein n=1 Tax=Corynebacterium mastitidis TaxID=161890 RepID=UPI0009FBF6D7|nr:DUF3800 domain-containing protein [Corynebacterium mastitidis]
MFIAYLDEFGHQGPFISPEHRKYNTHPIFGYGGYVIPAEHARALGGYFEQIKWDLLSWEIERDRAHPHRWEKKGARLLTSTNLSRYGGEIRPALKRIYEKLDSVGGRIFFFGQETPCGPVSVTGETSKDREAHCLIQTARRLGTYAKVKGGNMFIIMDATDTDNRERAVATLGRTIYSREGDTDSIIEIPLQADNRLYGTIQLADWTCALLMRISHYHFCEGSDARWSVDLARRVWRARYFTPNSIIWSNDLLRREKCFPGSLLGAHPF